MPIIEQTATDRTDKQSTWLRQFARNVYSQCGEDGVIEEILKRMPAQNRWCVEFGAWDGVFLSNTCRLIRESGWHAVQIEGNSQRFLQLQQNFAGNPNVHQQLGIVGYERRVNSMDDFLARTPIPKDFDLLSIDIDGNDYHVWASIEEYRPRLVLIEFNPTVPNHVIFVQDRAMAVSEGCSLAALLRLGKQKGYELIATTAFNAFFVLAEEFSRFGIEDNSIDAMYDGAGGAIFHGFNGKIYHTMGELLWKGRDRKLLPDGLQVLKPEEMFYGGRLPDADIEQLSAGPKPAMILPSKPD